MMAVVNIKKTGQYICKPDGKAHKKHKAKMNTLSQEWETTKEKQNHCVVIS